MMLNTNAISTIKVLPVAIKYRFALSDKNPEMKAPTFSNIPKTMKTYADFFAISLSDSPGSDYLINLNRNPV